jgi:hypothetical protein
VEGHDYALDPDAIEGWCKPCHDADSGRESRRQHGGGVNLATPDPLHRRGGQTREGPKFGGGYPHRGTKP